MDNDKIYLDKNGYEEYLKEIDELREKLNDNAKDKREANSSASGDGWHDNFDYEQAERERRMIISQIEEKKKEISKIVVIEPFGDEKLIDAGDFVCVEMDMNGKAESKVIKLTGSLKPVINSKFREITVNSPLGRALYGSKVGDKVSYVVKNKKVVVLIKDKNKNIENLQNNIKNR